jgi:hypothetical protein
MVSILITIHGQRCTLDLSVIKWLPSGLPDWERSRLSEARCEQWNWRAANGQLKEMACRRLLFRLERSGPIRLTPLHRKSSAWF